MFADHGDRAAALREALQERERVLARLPAPYWTNRARKECGVFERKRNGRIVVTVDVPTLVQKYRGHEIDFHFTDAASRLLAWRRARALRVRLVRKAELHFPKVRRSKRWPAAL